MGMLTEAVDNGRIVNVCCRPAQNKDIGRPLLTLASLLLCASFSGCSDQGRELGEVDTLLHKVVL